MMTVQTRTRKKNNKESSRRRSKRKKGKLILIKSDISSITYNFITANIHAMLYHINGIFLNMYVKYIENYHC